MVNINDFSGILYDYFHEVPHLYDCFFNFQITCVCFFPQANCHKDIHMFFEILKINIKILVPLIFKESFYSKKLNNRKSEFIEM